jgi:pimeloyl-ACP methyl ester carboxylesterase
MTFESAAVVSGDGTSIAYRALGRGPGVVLVHGGAGAAQSFSKLAAALAADFTVYVPDRRGRGQSGPFGDHHSLATECADLDALLRHTGARDVFGLSAGAVIALYAATKLTTIDRLAVYEPPLIIDGARPDAWVSRYEREVDRGDLAAALVTMLKGTGDVGPLTYAPRWLLRPVLGFVLRSEKPQPGRIPFRELIPTLRHDVRLVREATAEIETFASIRARMLILSGTRSARDLQVGARALARMLPRAQHIVLRGVGHTAALDDGKPDHVSAALRAFFKADDRAA